VTQLAPHPARLDLAREPDFSLGALTVSPSACLVRIGQRDQRIEPRVMAVLVVLARAANRTVGRDELIDTCWAGLIVSDDAVARAISQVRSLARDVEPPPFRLETVPKVGFRLHAEEGVGPAAAIEGSPPRPAQEPTRDPQRRRRRIRLAAGAALGVLTALAVVIGLKLHPGQERGGSGRVEVMPFEALQKEPVLQRYAKASSDALVRVLASNQIETTEAPIGSTASDVRSKAELGVRGTVDRDGDAYVVNAQVIDRASGDVLWSGRFERDAKAPVGFQEQTGNLIGDAIHCALWHRAAGGAPIDDALLSLLLDACADWRGDPSTFLAAADRLVRAAPGWSYAHSIRAHALAFVAVDLSTTPAESEAASRAAAQDAQRALRIDPRNGEAYHALAARFEGRGHWLEREQDFTRAAQLSPSLPFVNDLYVGMLREVGRWSDATDLNRRTVAADPFSAPQLASLAILQASAGDLQDAEALTKRADLLNPEEGAEARATIALWWKDPAEAIAELRTHPSGPKGCFEAYLARLLRATGGARRGLPAACADVDPAYRVRMLAREGDIDGAYAAFEADPNAWRYPTVFFYPEMKAFRRDPRFMPLAARLGLTGYWRRSGHWPDFCAEPGLPYDCKAEASRLLHSVPARP
jgi:DNA-binding winged helix-turn-helix (wHTH) protein/TolB-like protein/tetratricopeptide (TPR) repeat protein